MARILAIDWDGVEARFALGSVRKDRLIVWKAGSAPIADAVDAVAEAEEEDDEDAEVVPPSPDDESADEDGEEGDSPLEIVETTGTKKAPIFDEDDEEEEDEDPRVVSTTRKKKGESYKTSPLAKTLKKLLRDNRVGKATVLYAAERGDVDILYANVPQASDAETPELVLNQALRESTTFNETQPLDYLPLGAPSRFGTRSVVAVSIARDKLRRIRETLIGATRAPSKIELREPALAEFLRADFCKLAFDEPTLLIQALCDEVNLTLCDAEKNVIYFRSFKVAVDLSAPALARRIREEVARSLAVGVSELPEDAVVRKALFFSDASSLGASLNVDFDETDENARITEISEDGEDAASVVVGSLQLGERLARELEEEEIELEFANPFRVAGVELKSSEPENPGRFASLLGALLAERPQCRPAIDLLHPREKPKPPKYWAIVVAFLVLVGAGFGAAWKWNKTELERERAELAELQKKAQAAQMEAQRKMPLANALNSANAWRNVQGVVVLDELRDLALRIPQAPELVVTRLGYLANLNGRPAFVISAKIKSAEVYQRFYQSLTRDGSHSVISRRGPVANPGGGGYPSQFEAQIVCRRRPAQTFVATLPQELREISNNLPEYFAERQAEIQREREEAAAKAAAEREEALRRRQEEMQKQAEAARQAQEAAAQAETPTEAAPAQAETPTEAAPAPAETPTESAPTPAETPVEAAPAQAETPAEPAPAQAETPTEAAPAPAEPPAEPAPAQAETPTEAAPAPAETPTEAAPTQAETPAEPAPAQAETATESAPAPTETPTESAPTQAEPPAEAAAGGQPTLEQQAQFGFQLMRQRYQLNVRLQYAQNMTRQGRMNQAQYQQTFAQYQTATNNVLTQWNALPEAARAKAQELWNEQLKKAQNNQNAQNAQPAETPATPATAAEQPAAPAPEAPAAVAPAAPAPEGAPSAALERSQTAWTEA